MYKDQSDLLGAGQAPLEPLAIVGLALKFPGDADTTEGFWRVLQEKRCLMTEWPQERFRMDAFFQKPASTQKAAVPGGHFLKDDVGLFDAPFFGLSATEAMTMDPQSRILLETTFHALENAGIRMQDVAGSRTGVYSGAMTNDYAFMTHKDTDNLPQYLASGTSQSMIANRISWFYDLKGPSIHMDSACSSSLMAFHTACESLHSRTSDLVVVAGASTCLSVETTLSLASMGFLSPQGKCFSFDDRADGYSRGEGFSVVLVKRLSDAISAGNTIRAVVRSTGANQDGHTPGITQPSMKSQAALIQESYRKAKLSLNHTRYFEAHGTGTAIGDPIEAEAIGSTFRKVRSPDDPLYIGALKSNVGHLEGGSGLAGVIKTVMVLENGMIPPNANFERINPRIDADFFNIKFPTECIPWPSNGLRRASVSSFGFGGANAHVIMDDAYHFLEARQLGGFHRTVIHPSHGKSQTTPSPCLNGGVLPALTNGCAVIEEKINGSRDATSIPMTDPPNSQLARVHTRNDSGISPAVNGETHAPIAPLHVENGTNGDLQHPTGDRTQLLIFSAADADGVQRSVSAYQDYFEAAPWDAIGEAKFMDQLAHTLACRRSILTWRSFALVEESSQLSTISRLVSKPQRVDSPLGTAFVFTGQGAQYAKMGGALLEHPTFRSVITEFDSVLAHLGSPFSVIDFLRGSKPDCDRDIHDPMHSQPVTTALQLALTALMHESNVRPKMVVGHSSGEIAAAYAAGALNLSSACKVSYFRGLVTNTMVQTASSSGAMLSVNEPREIIQKRIDQDPRYAGRLHVACINSPKNVTVSGNEAEIDMLRSELEDEDIFARKLNTGVAYHSPQMQAIAAGYAFLIEGIERSHSVKHRPVFVSSVTGKVVQDLGEICAPQYWVRNLVSPVEFTAAMDAMLETTVSGQTWKLGDVKCEAIGDVIEIGPHPALRRPVLDILDQAGLRTRVNYHHLLDRARSSMETVQRTMGQLFARGHAVHVDVLNSQGRRSPGSTSCQLLDLPTYPFNHSRSYWYEPEVSRNTRMRTGPKLELLGTPVPDWNPLEARWRKTFDAAETPWISEHQVNGRIIYPAAGMLAMAVEAVRQLADTDRPIRAFQVSDVVFSNPITIEAAERTDVEVCLQHDMERSNKNINSYGFRIYTRSRGSTVVNCRGICQLYYESGGDGFLTIDRQDENRHHQAELTRVKAVCDTDIPSEKIYTLLENNGLAYGPSFQRLSQIGLDRDRSAAAQISCFEWNNDQSRNARQDHVIHPTTLDAAAQLACAALTKGQTEGIFQGFVVTRMERVWISGTGLSFPKTPLLNAYCDAAFKGPRNANASVVAMDTAGTPKLIISGMECTALGGMVDNVAPSIPRQLSYSMHWKPDPDFLDANHLRALAPATQPPAIMKQFLEDIECVQDYYTIDALKRKPSYDFQTMAPHLKRYFAWLERQTSLREKSIGRPISPKIADEMAMQDTIRRTKNTNAQGDIVNLVGQNLPDIFSGRVDPLQLMFGDGLASRIYSEGFEEMAARPQLQEYLGLLRHKNPGLKVIEVGAGTGSVTACALDVLSVNEHLSRYDYTDISSTFFEEASVRFAAFKNSMAFRALNIELDPVQQGFEANSYDIVIASQVLHATRSLAVTLQNTRRLLKPGGKLIFIETTEPTLPTCAFAFGTLEGWWTSTDEDRYWSPCVSDEYWDSVLKQSGFTGVDIFLPDDQVGHQREMNLMVSTANLFDDHPPRSLSSDAHILLVYDSGSSTQISVKDELETTRFNTLDDSYSAISTADLPQLSTTSASTLVSIVELDRSYLTSLDEATFLSLQRLLMTVETAIWVTSESQPASSHFAGVNMATGFARTLASERPNLTIITLALESPSSPPSPEHPAHRILQILDSPEAQRPGHLDFREEHGLLTIPRILPSPPLDLELHRRNHPTTTHQPWSAAPALTLTVANPGLLDSTHFIASPSSPSSPLEPGTIEVLVRAVGINFYDLFVAMGKLPVSTMGCEFSGIVTRVGPPRGDADDADSPVFSVGQRVVAPLRGCLATYARPDVRLAVPVPDAVSFAQAASVPVTALTAYYGLLELGRLRAGETVLIHSAAGGTGQMAVQIARSVGAEIYATVGTEGKKRLLMEEYGIPEERIFGSRDTGFADGVRRATGGEGVDVVFNSLSGQALTASWEVVRAHGRFIEIGKTDIFGNSKLPMGQFAKSVTFSAFDLHDVLEAFPERMGKMLGKIMGMLDSGALKVAQPLQEYPMSKVEDALRMMQSGKNSGKMVLTVDDDCIVETYLHHRHTYSFDGAATYMITGGLGGLGRSAARWMAERGAKNLILLSRSGPRSDAARKLVADLTATGVRVVAPLCDASSMDSLTQALNECSHLPPIKGCIQGTMVLQDALFETMTWTQWSTSILSKVNVSHNLHTLLPRDLDFFILLSSIASLVGQIGQSNYAAGNAYQDALAQHRRSQGLAATSLDLGWISDVGVVAESADLTESIKASSTSLPTSEREFLALLDYYCDPARRSEPLNPDSTLPLQPMLGFTTAAHARLSGQTIAAHMRDNPLLRALAYDNGTGSGGAGDGAGGESSGTAGTEERNLAAEFTRETSEAGRAAIVEEALVRKLARALSAAAAEIDRTRPLHVHGVDSLLAVELRNWFAKVFRADVAIFDITGQVTLTALAAGAAKGSKLGVGEGVKG